MDRVDLFTGTGAPKLANFVATVQIPPFLPGHKPGVVIWGDRVFTHSQLVSPKNFKHQAYSEVFAVVAVARPQEDDFDEQAGPDQGAASEGNGAA